MFNFVKKLLFARMFEIEEGKISILGHPWVMAPATVMLQLIRNIGLSKRKHVYKILYESSKETGIEYITSMKQNIKDMNKLIDVGVNSLNLGGWGKVIVDDFDFNKKRGIVRFQDSVMGKLWLERYGKSKEPIDYIMCGFVTGGLSVITGTNIEGIEKRCVAMGDPFCEFILKPSKG